MKSLENSVRLSTNDCQGCQVEGGGYPGRTSAHNDYSVVVGEGHTPGFYLKTWNGASEFGVNFYQPAAASIDWEYETREAARKLISRG